MSRFPAAFRPPVLASWAILCPLATRAFLTVGLPGTSLFLDPTGLSRSARVRPGRLGCPAVASRPAMEYRPGSSPPAMRGQVRAAVAPVSHTSSPPYVNVRARGGRWWIRTTEGEAPSPPEPDY